jgi:hypothetical protein
MRHDRYSDPYPEHHYLPDTLLLVIASVLFAGCGLLWLVGQVAAILFGAHEHLPVRLVDMLGVLIRLPGTWEDPARAWPPELWPLLPGPVGMYAAAVLTVWLPLLLIGLLMRMQQTEHFPVLRPWVDRRVGMMSEVAEFQGDPADPDREADSTVHDHRKPDVLLVEVLQHRRRTIIGGAVEPLRHGRPPSRELSVGSVDRPRLGDKRQICLIIRKVQNGRSTRWSAGRRPCMQPVLKFIMF